MYVIGGNCNCGVPPVFHAVPSGTQRSLCGTAVVRVFTDAFDPAHPKSCRSCVDETTDLAESLPAGARA